jgi:predicted nucleic acid-binding protein
VNGIKFLLDTNFILGVVKKTGPVVKALTERAIALDECAYSFITRIELLGYSAITPLEIESIESI